MRPQFVLLQSGAPLKLEERIAMKSQPDHKVAFDAGNVHVADLANDRI